MHNSKPRHVSIVNVRYLILDRIEVYQEESKRAIEILKQTCKADGNGKIDISKVVMNTMKLLHSKNDQIVYLLGILCDLEEAKDFRNYKK